MRVLEQLTIKNYKSIRDQTLKLAPLNIFIGGNGSGKSNFLGFFHFLNRVVSGGLQTHTGVAGGADSLLHFGRKRSPSMSVELIFTEASIGNGYKFELLPTENDGFVFKSESIL